MLVNDDRRLPAGKLPADLLERLLSHYVSEDPRVLIGPRVGTDAAAIDMGGSVLVVKSDPITFATREAGWYLVHVNANDIACMGAEPRWLLVTALLPENETTPRLVSELFQSISNAAVTLGVSLIGGHTEITIGVDRPILVGLMLGETTAGGLIDPRVARPGDAIMLCKGIAIEGTALLAQEAIDDSRLRHLNASLLARSAEFLRVPGISVVDAARALVGSGADVRGMHDPTEGGLASALHELCAATGLSIEIDAERILVYPETDAICRELGLDPLGLIASGALLAVVPEGDVDRVMTAATEAGFPAAQIGSFTQEGANIHFRSGNELQPFPSFEVDEIARYFASRHTT